MVRPSIKVDQQVTVLDVGNGGDTDQVGILAVLGFNFHTLTETETSRTS